jgi:hypothetical protein
MDDEMREKLDFSMRVQVLGTLYHWACGEVIQFRLAFRHAPEIDVSEDLATDNVTQSHGDQSLTLRPGRSHEEDRTVIRAWIEEHVDVSRLKLSKRHSAGLSYWRGRATRW